MNRKKLLNYIFLSIFTYFLFLNVLVFARNSGSIWTTRNDCGDEKQDVNHYEIGDHIYINGANFESGEYDWIIKGQPGGASCDPDQIVADGTFTVGESGNFCFDAYTVHSDDCGEYKVKFENKGDNYRVKGITTTTTTSTTTSTTSSTTTTCLTTSTTSTSTTSSSTTTTCPSTTSTTTSSTSISSTSSSTSSSSSSSTTSSTSSSTTTTCPTSTTSSSTTSSTSSSTSSSSSTTSSSSSSTTTRPSTTTTICGLASTNCGLSNNQNLVNTNTEFQQALSDSKLTKRFYNRVILVSVLSFMI